MNASFNDFKDRLKKLCKVFKTEEYNQQQNADLALLPPPAVWSRALIWTLGAGSVGILTWSIVTKVEEMIILPGEITTEIPGVQVTAFDPGFVTAVHIKPHEEVRAGQLLLTYNDDETSDRLASQQKKRTLLQEQKNQQQNIFLTRRQQIENQISLDQELLTRLERLQLVGAIQETQILEKRTQLNKDKLSLVSLKSEMLRSTNESNRLIEEADQVIRELLKKQLRFSITAPVDGFVQEIRFQTIGERIRSSDLICTIVPSQELSATVRVPSKLSAPLRKNTIAAVDVDAFPASDFGSVDAFVESISPTTSLDSGQSQQKSYDVQLTLTQAQDPETLKLSELRPGMAITARIRLREKPVIATVFNFLENLFGPLNEQR